MFSVRPRDGNEFWRTGPVRLMLFETRETGEFIADFDHSVPGDIEVSNGRSIGGMEVSVA